MVSARRLWCGVVAAALAAGCIGANPNYLGPVVDAREPPRDRPSAELGRDLGSPRDSSSEADAADAQDDTAEPDSGPGEDAADDGAGMNGGVDAPDAAIDDVLAAPDAEPPDAGPDGREDASDGRPPAEPGCGWDRPDISMIRNADGLAIGRDGTIYWGTSDTTSSYVGRRLPDGRFQLQWLRLTGETITWGLALDDGRRKLYLAMSTGVIYRYDLAFDPPPRTTLTTAIKRPNDIAVYPPDGSIYVSDHDTDLVRRVLATGTVSNITAQALRDGTTERAPAGLAFGLDGALYVGMYANGPLTRVALSSTGAGQFTQPWGQFSGWGNGLAFDRTGRVYVGIFHETAENRIVRLDARGLNPVTVHTGGRFASLAFGRGTLDCSDLYAADPKGALVRIATDTPGLPMP